MNKYLYSLGLMSGTSIDGVDASIIKSDGENFVEIIDDLYLKYDDNLRSRIQEFISSCNSKEDFERLMNISFDVVREITLFHADVCKKILERNKKIKVDLIGFHGQTVLHRPEEGYTIQIGDSKLLSKQVKTTVVSNFRENDISNGGQGAPLTPLYHKVILKKIKSIPPCVIINIGGIANITYVENEKNIESFDCGPGNYLIDKWVKEKMKINFDKNGDLAKKGKVNKNFIENFLLDSYYKKKKPKSLDIKDLNLINIEKLSLEDGCATLSMITAETICYAIKNIEKTPNTIIFTGGGRKNEFIIECIKKKLNKPVHLIDEFNFDGDFTESQAFAYLAIRSYLNKFISLPGTTGVKKPSVGGLICKFKL